MPDLSTEQIKTLLAKAALRRVRQQALPREVQDTVDGAVQNILPRKMFKNKYKGEKFGPLPPGTYEEFDVPVPKGGGKVRGDRRVIYDRSTGRAYYSDNFHEGPPGRAKGDGTAARFVEIENPGLR